MGRVYGGVRDGDWRRKSVNASVRADTQEGSNAGDSRDPRVTRVWCVVIRMVYIRWKGQEGPRWDIGNPVDIGRVCL